MARDSIGFELLERLRNKQQAIALAIKELAVAVDELRNEAKELSSEVHDLVVEVDKLKKVVLQ